MFSELDIGLATPIQFWHVKHKFKVEGNSVRIIITSNVEVQNSSSLKRTNKTEKIGFIQKIYSHC